MAHANLQVSKSLQTAFEKAQSSEPMRWLMAKVSDVTFDLFKAGKSSGDLGRDLESLKQALDADACIIIVCVDETSSPKKWTLVAYVPSTEKVKRRMLFASGRNDIKRFLGQEYFKGEAHVEDKADLTVEAVMRDKTELEDLPYTMEELAIKEDHAQSSRPSGKTEKGMANVEFPLTPALEAALLEFRQGTVDWIEVEVTKEEQVGVVQKASIRSLTASVQPRIDSKNPRFYLACRCGTAMGDRTYLVFCCPEMSQIRLRMVYATCKASILEQEGLKFDKLLEIRSPDELDALFVSEETIDEDAGKIKHQDMSKPRGPPGRTKR